MSITITPGVAPVSPVAPAARPVAANTAASPAETATPAKDPRGPTLASQTAAILLEAQNQPAEVPRSVYENYMPVREGFSAHALAVGIKDPDAVSSSAGLDDAGVVADARARLDEKYARMEASGEPFGKRPWEGEDWYSVSGDLDRRSLSAILSSSEGTFSAQERQIAEWGLQLQDNMRQGAYVGPTRLFGQYLASGMSYIPKAAAEDLMKTFDAEAAKDKSLPSVMGRATMRVLLGEEASNALFGGVGTSAEDKMLGLLVTALTKAREKDPDLLDKLDRIKTPEDLKKADWFSDHREALDKILAGVEAPEAATA